jgi:hypothetical protein
MAGTTPCEGWPFPTLGDLFQRHWICDLATAMDTSLQERKVIADELVAKPAVQVHSVAQAIATGVATLITFTVADDDDYDMWNGTMSPGVTDRVFVRPQQSGMWFFKARCTAAFIATMTYYLIEILTVDTAGAITVRAARNESGNMQNANTSGDTITAVLPLQPGDAVAVRFTWAGGGGPASIGCYLEGALLSMCDKGNFYYNDWEDGGLGGWTGTNAVLTNSAAYASHGTRSLLVTPVGGFAIATATGPFVTLPPHSNNFWDYYSGVIRTGAAAPPGPIRLGQDYFDGAFVNVGTASVTIVAPPANTTFRPPPGPYNIPATAVYTRPYFALEGTPAVGQAVHFDQTTLVRACGLTTTT